MAEERDQRDAAAAASGDGDQAAAAAEEMPRNPLADLRLRRPPFWMIAAFLIFVVVSWLPLVVAARRRVSTTESPQIHMIQDMDNQPRYRGQQGNPVFADGRTVRPTVAGTRQKSPALSETSTLFPFSINRPRTMPKICGNSFVT
jgi:hypothetical protein